MAFFKIVVNNNMIARKRDLDIIFKPHYLKVENDDISAEIKIENRVTEKIYLEQDSQSFVASMGWLYQIDSDIPYLSELQYKTILENHKKKNHLPFEQFSGNFAFISYDRESHTMWIVCDKWGQNSFYYGSNDDVFVISSSSLTVANEIKSSINGYNFINKIRGAGYPPGTSLFQGVFRILPRKAIKLDLNNKKISIEEVLPLYQDILNISFQDSVDLLVDLIRRMCIRTAKLLNLAIDLTGGHDTRMTAAALTYVADLSSREDLTFKVHQDRNHPDAIIANQIANLLGWKLKIFPRDFELFDKSLEALKQAVIYGDGNRFPLDFAKAIQRQITLWNDYQYLWGSLGGELLRGWFWTHEGLKIGKTPVINYNAMFKHRFYASNNIDLNRLIGNKLSLTILNDYIISQYKSVERKLPDELLNAYKLDIFFLFKEISNSDYWEMSHFRTNILPYMNAETTDIFLRIPFKFRINRKLFIYVVNYLSPLLSKIPTDKGLLMEPLTFSILPKYVIADVKVKFNMIYRHFIEPKIKRQELISLNLPKEWINLLYGSKIAQELTRSNKLLNKLKEHLPLNKEEYNEIQMVLLLEIISSQYKNIKIEFCFD